MESFALIGILNQAHLGEAKSSGLLQCRRTASGSDIDIAACLYQQPSNLGLATIFHPSQ
jgi:hypothetical protein